MFDRQRMLERLDAGYDPIDVSIEKWKDKQQNWDETDAGGENCALCYIHHKPDESQSCDSCPLFKIGDRCTNNSSFDKAINKHDAQIMLDALYKAKEWQRQEQCKGTKTEPEKPAEKTYHIGQRFKFKSGPEYHEDEETYLLARGNQDNDDDGDDTVLLVNIDEGKRWNRGAKVKNLQNITEDEFRKIIGMHWGPENFILQEEPEEKQKTATKTKEDAGYEVIEPSEIADKIDCSNLEFSVHIERGGHKYLCIRNKDAGGEERVLIPAHGNGWHRFTDKYGKMHTEYQMGGE